MNQHEEPFSKLNDLVFVYTSQEAVEDGILFDLDRILTKNPAKPFFLKYVTTNLLKKGYLNPPKEPDVEITLNIPNLKDILNQAAIIFRKKPADDYFASGRIELPDGQKQRIFIAENETGRYTAMLPEDY
ncbi:MAG: hypothetical protein NWE93_10125 [Candidatus Bathyarchaeota archaeon]|nr:hypothetical protein [Candidatus Bathyarchaeota archaeon]